MMLTNVTTRLWTSLWHFFIKHGSDSINELPKRHSDDLKMDDAIKATVIVHSGRGLVSKRHSTCFASVVFGLGKDLYATEVIESNTPSWKQEAIFTVTTSEKESFKFKVKDKDHTIGSLKIPVNTAKTTAQLQWHPLEPHKKGSAAHGELLIEYWLNSPFKSEPATVLRTPSPVSDEAVERNRLGSGLKDYFRKTTPIIGRKAKDEEKRESFGRGHLHSSDSQLHVSPSAAHQEGSQTPNPSHLTTHRNSSPQELIPKVESFRSSEYGDEDFSGSQRTSKSESEVYLPEVTGVSPRESPLEGGHKITLRGSCLGTSHDDVMAVILVDVDCTDSLEYISSEKLAVTTFPRTKPASGPVIVETRSAGRGESAVEFCFVESKIRRHERKVSDTVFTRKSKDEQDTIKQLQRQLTELKLENSSLKESHESLQEYISNLTLLVLQHNPSLLSHDLLHGNRNSEK